MADIATAVYAGSTLSKPFQFGYQPHVEGLRAVAILLVVAAHFGVPAMEGGFVGVDVFFVLSGYLITALLMQEISATGGVNFAEFYSRRLRRLLPALLLVLVCTSLLAAAILPPTEQSDQAISAVSAALWLSNFHFALSDLDYFGPDSSRNLFLHTWSLGIEEQFYLIWPAILLLTLGGANQTGLSFVRLKRFMLALATVSLLGCIALTYIEPRLAFYMMPTRAWQFALGALALLYGVHISNREEESALERKNLVSLMGWAGLCLISASALLFDPKTSYPGANALLPAMGTAATLAATHLAAHGPRRLLSWYPLQALGKVSYAWYLWHWPVLILGARAVGSDDVVYRSALAGLSLLLATATYRFIESPIRKRRGLLKYPTVLVGVALTSMTAVATASVHWRNTASNWMTLPSQARYLKIKNDLPAIYTLDCDSWIHNAEVRICEFGRKDAKRTAVLMGDSVAGQWFPAVSAAINKAGWRLLVITKSACPMVDESYFYPQIGKIYDICDSWRTDALKRVAAVNPDLILLSSTSTYDFDESQWIGGTKRVLNALTASTDRIYILRAPPTLPFNGPDCLASRQWLPWFQFMRASCESTSLDPKGLQVYTWQKKAADGLDNVTMIDLNESICPDGICYSEYLGVPVYRDTQHLTATFVQSLEPVLAQRLQLTH